MMKTLSLAILLGACVDPAATPEPSLHQHYAYVVATNATEAPAPTKPILAGDVVSDDVCNTLPADGSCDAACDPTALAAEIPAGTCGDFVCALTDGTFLRYGGCTP